MAGSGPSGTPGAGGAAAGGELRGELSHHEIEELKALRQAG
jgi:hypothetical protein